jgi:hypothetical protein
MHFSCCARLRETIADGDVQQDAKAGLVTSHAIFRFKDGSIHEETTVFSQDRIFRLVRYELLQKGPSFKHPLRMTVDPRANQVTVHSWEEQKEKTTTTELNLPEDLANRMIPTLLKNFRTGERERTLSLVASSATPVVIKLRVVHDGEKWFSSGQTRKKANHYVVKVEIPGWRGIAAKIFQRQPADTQVWILDGEAPSFVQSEGPLCADGPVWRIQIAAKTRGLSQPSFEARSRRTTSCILAGVGIRAVYLECRLRGGIRWEIDGQWAGCLPSFSKAGPLCWSPPLNSPEEAGM